MERIDHTVQLSFMIRQSGLRRCPYGHYGGRSHTATVCFRKKVNSDFLALLFCPATVAAARAPLLGMFQLFWVHYSRAGNGKGGEHEVVYLPAHSSLLDFFCMHHNADLSSYECICHINNIIIHSHRE